jgi:hypothetical protein
MLPPENERPRSFVKSTTTKLAVLDGNVKRINPARLVDVVSSLILFVNVVVKYPGRAAVNDNQSTLRTALTTCSADHLHQPSVKQPEHSE